MASLGSTAAIGVLGLALLAGCSGEKAAQGTAQQTAGCVSAVPRLFGPQPGPPKALSAALDKAIVARFAIFRRDVPVRDGLGRELSRDYTLASWYPGYVRRVGRRYDVVPAFGRRETVVSPGCASARTRLELVEQQLRRTTEPVYCIVEAGRDGSIPLGCEPFAAVGEDAEIFRPGAASGEPIVELVPDGVAAVRISYRARAPIVVPVSDNAIVFAPPPPSPRVATARKRLGSLKTVGGYCSRGGTHSRWSCHFTRLTKAQQRQRKKAVAEYDAAAAADGPTKVEWLDRAGGLMRTIDPPTARRIAAISVGDLRAPIRG